MGIVQKDALRTSVIAYLGIVLGYVNKGLLFIVFLTMEEIGLVNLLVLVGAMFAQFANFGSFNAIWRFFPILQNADKKHHGFLAYNGLIAALGTVVITLLVVLFNRPIIGYYSVNSALFAEWFYWVIPCGIGILIYKLLDGYVRALYKSVFSIFVNDVVLRLLVMAALLGYAYKFYDFSTFVIFICLAQWVPALMLVGYVYSIGELHVKRKHIQIPSRLKRIIIQYSSFSYLNSVGTSIIITIDALMVAGMLGLKETGIYTTVAFISRALVIPYTAIMRVSIPIVPQLWKKRDMKGMKEMYVKVSSVSLVIGLTLFLGVWVNRESLFEIFPAEFEAGIYVFLFLMIGKLVDMYFGLNGTILITSKKYNYDILFTVFLLIMVILLNWYLIPEYGAVGAAISTGTAYVIYNILRLFFVYWHYRIFPFEWRQIAVICLFGAVLSLFEFIPYQLSNIWFDILLKSATAMLLFPALIYLLRLEKETVSYVNKVKAIVFKKK